VSEVLLHEAEAQGFFVREGKCFPAAQRAVSASPTLSPPPLRERPPATAFPTALSKAPSSACIPLAQAFSSFFLVLRSLSQSPTCNTVISLTHCASSLCVLRRSKTLEKVCFNGFAVHSHRLSSIAEGCDFVIFPIILLSCLCISGVGDYNWLLT